MADNELSSDPIAILERVSVRIETARKSLQVLYEQLIMTNVNAKEIARNELCRAEGCWSAFNWLNE